MYSHPCIKCKTTYQSNDVDPYYCDTCNAERIKVAKEIDAKLSSRPRRQTMSALQEYDASQKMGGFMIVKP